MFSIGWLADRLALLGWQFCLGSVCRWAIYGFASGSQTRLSGRETGPPIGAGWGWLGPQFAVFSLQCSARGGGSRRETMNEKRKMQSGRRAAD